MLSRGDVRIETFAQKLGCEVEAIRPDDRIGSNRNVCESSRIEKLSHDRSRIGLDECFQVNDALRAVGEPDPYPELG